METNKIHRGDKFRHLDLFSGIGGFALAASWVWGQEHEIVSFCEIESFPQKVLKKHWPDVHIHDDIKTMKGDQYGRIDLLTGGFPCQPYSVAGKQRGSDDDRALWPEMLRVIKEAKPDWIIGENVAGFINMGIDDSLSDLESQGYETTAFIIPACAKDARHRRDRVWIVAHSKRFGCNLWSNTSERNKNKSEWSDTENRQQREQSRVGFGKNGKAIPYLPNTRAKRVCEWENNADKKQWDPEPTMGRMAYGIPNRVDRIKGLGNAIVPQVVVPFMQAIKYFLK